MLKFPQLEVALTLHRPGTLLIVEQTSLETALALLQPPMATILKQVAVEVDKLLI